MEKGAYSDLHPVVIFHGQLDSESLFPISLLLSQVIKLPRANYTIFLNSITFKRFNTSPLQVGLH